MMVCGMENTPSSYTTPFMGLSKVFMPKSRSWLSLVKCPIARMQYTLPDCFFAEDSYSEG